MVAHGVVGGLHAAESTEELVHVQPFPLRRSGRVRQRAKETDGIMRNVFRDGLGRVDSRHFNDGRKKIRRIDQRFGDTALHHAGSGHDQRHVHAALVNGALGTVGVEGRGDDRAPGPIVAHEDDIGVVPNLGAEPRKQPADLRIHGLDHRDEGRAPALGRHGAGIHVGVVRLPVFRRGHVHRRVRQVE